jgi:hypothetical protein
MVPAREVRADAVSAQPEREDCLDAASGAAAARGYASQGAVSVLLGREMPARHHRPARR